MTQYEKQLDTLRQQVTERSVADDVIAYNDAANSDDVFKVRSGNIRRLGRTERWQLKTKTTEELLDECEW